MRKSVLPRIKGFGEVDEVEVEPLTTQEKLPSASLRHSAQFLHTSGTKIRNKIYII